MHGHAAAMTTVTVNTNSKYKPIVYTDASGRGEVPLVGGKYHEFPVTLFRWQQGTAVCLRDYLVQSSLDTQSYDICTDNGVAVPLDGRRWKGVLNNIYIFFPS